MLCSFRLDVARELRVAVARRAKEREGTSRNFVRISRTLSHVKKVVDASDDLP